MGKVILTESQYQRLKKRLINIQLNEQDSGGLVSGLLLGGLVGLAYQAYQGFKGGSYSGVKALFSVCASTGVGKTTMSQAALNNITKSLYDAVRVWDGTDEDAIKAALSQVKTIPDFCAVNKTYSENHPGYTLFDDLNGDIDNDSEWNEYVYLPLLNAKRNTDEIIRKAKLLPTPPVPGTSEINWGSMTSGEIIAFQRWYWSVIEKDLPRVSGDVNDTCSAKYASALCGGSPCILNQAVDGRLGQNFVKLTTGDANRRAFEAWWKINKNGKTASGLPYTSLPAKCSSVQKGYVNPKSTPKSTPKTVPVNTGSGGKRPSDPVFPTGYESGLK